ncbi:hypothetical protein RSK20926_10729 [Roseobacter sp. SK209-2-6]|nr:hypothetical protein RSK20926_10729 [Roseobacter sp. SK209-2-6]
MQHAELTLGDPVTAGPDPSDRGRIVDHGKANQIGSFANINPATIK